MKKIWIIGAAISLTLILGACSKQTQTTPSTTAVETTDRELADQASKEVEVMESLEADGKVIYDDESGDIIEAPSEDIEQLHEGIMNKIRDDVRNGRIGEEEIEDIVTTLCDFLEGESLTEFITELRGLLPKVEETKAAPKETKSVKDKETVAETVEETQPAAIQPTSSPEEIEMTMPNPVNTEPTEDPLATEPDPSTYQTIGNTTFIDAPLSSEQNLTPEQIDAINNSSWN